MEIKTVLLMLSLSANIALLLLLGCISLHKESKDENDDNNNDKNKMIKS